MGTKAYTATHVIDTDPKSVTVAEGANATALPEVMSKHLQVVNVVLGGVVWVRSYLP
jgi:hypothetical protein